MGDDPGGIPSAGGFAPADDRTVVIVVDRSGGRSGPVPPLGSPGAQHGREVVLVDRAEQEQAMRVRASAQPITEVGVASTFGRWLAWRIVHRGGWTVHIDAPDRDPIRIRCRTHDAALTLAHQIAED